MSSAVSSAAAGRERAAKATATRRNNPLSVPERAAAGVEWAWLAIVPRRFYYSKEILQHALIEFSGTLLIVSHDIDFLKPIISKVLEIRDNRAKLFIGGIDYYLFKREETDSLDAVQKSDNDPEKINRKELKRTEAELRQKRYNLTKGFKKDLEIIEGKIKELELRITQLEVELADPKTFTSPQLAKDKNFEYDTCKKELELKYDKWSEISLKIEEAEQSII